MSKINIREIDSTGSVTREYQDYTVLVPAVKLECEIGHEECVGTLDGYYESFADFKSAFKIIRKHSKESGGTALPENWEKDIGFITACECLNNGLTIHYWGAYETVSEDGRCDAAEEAGFDFLATPEVSREQMDKYFYEFTDKGKYDFGFITVGGFRSDNARKAALICAAMRGDAQAVLDVNEEFDKFKVNEEGSAPSFNTNKSWEYTDAIEAWLVDSGIRGLCAEKVTRTGASGASWTVQETIGRYGALFAPSIIVKNLKTYGPEKKDDLDTDYTYRLHTSAINNNGYHTIPASLNYLANFGYCTSLRNPKINPWKAVAGVSRGKGVYEIAMPIIELGDADIDVVQVDEGDVNKGHVATNLILKRKPYGYCIWGARSMQPLLPPEKNPDEVAQLTASSFASVRWLCNVIKKSLYRASVKHSFDPNSDQLWFNFRADISPTLEKAKADEGVRGYTIDKVATKKKALLVASINIDPIEPVDRFDLTVEMSDTDGVVTE